MPAKKQKSAEDIQAEIAKKAKLFDVADPGKTPASSTSRPIIVRHSAMIQHDPMMVEEGESTEPETAPVSKKGKTLVREVEADKPAEELKVEEPTKPVEPAAEEKPAEPEVKDTEEAQADSESTGTGVIGVVAEEIDLKKKNKKDDEDDEAHQVEVHKIIQSKEFFVPIGQVSRQRSSRQLLLVVITLLVLGLLGANFAIDAGMLDVGVKALTDIL